MSDRVDHLERVDPLEDDLLEDAADPPTNATARALGDTLEPCARCGRPVARASSRGPHEHYASSCGCRGPGWD